MRFGCACYRHLDLFLVRNHGFVACLNHRQLQLLVAEIMTILEYLRDGFQTARCGSEETKEGLARRQHSGQVLGVELDADVPLVVFEFDDLHTLAGLVLADERETAGLELLDEGRVDFVAVAMAFPHFLLLAVEFPQTRPFGSRLEDGGALAETHRPAHLRLVDLGHVHDDGLLALLVEFGAARLVHPADVAGEFDHGELHAEADAQVGDVVGSGPLGALDHSFGATFAEAALASMC